MSHAESWTIQRLLTWTTDFLRRHDCDSPRLDAEILLAHALDCKRIELYTRFDEEPDDNARASFRELVKQRSGHMPVAYLVGHKEFFSLRMEVTPDVLIPRPETELLVMTVLDLVKEREAGSMTLCDVGTGSGAIAVTLAKHLDDARLTATDLSDAAIEVARRNAAKHDVADRVEFLECDLMTALPSEPTFDFVVSNPPYVTEAEYEQLEPDVRQYEPRLALVSGKDGCDAIRRLIPQAAERLKPGGHLLIELSPMIHDRALDILKAETRLEPLPSIRDLAQHQRIIAGRRRS